MIVLAYSFSKAPYELREFGYCDSRNVDRCDYSRDAGCPKSCNLHDGDLEVIVENKEGGNI